MQRIFYYSSEGIKVFLWSKKTLLGILTFDNNTEGLEEFEEYINSAPKVYTRLLIDVIDEDFRRESIPHVGNRDRKALVQRLLKRHFQDEEHCHVQYFGRQTSGRKDDNILLSCLTNLEKLAPWVNSMQQHGIALAGIWSVPLLTKDLLKRLNLKANNLLLVTRELPWSQRETFFKDGNLVFSRLERVDADLYQTQDQELSWQFLQTSAEQIQHFISNQRIIGFHEKITVVCIVPQAIIDQNKNTFISTNQIDYQLVSEAEVCEGLSANKSQTFRIDFVFSWLCSNKTLFSDHYATKKIKSQFYRFFYKTTFKSAAVFVALCLLSSAAFLWLHTINTQQYTQQTQQHITALKQRYIQQFGHMETQLADAELLFESVQHAKHIDEESRETPQKYFDALANIYSQQRFRSLRVDRLIWTKYPRDNIPQVLSQRVKHSSNDQDDQQGYNEAITPPVPTRLKYQALLSLHGELDRHSLNYRHTVDVMSEFVASLEKLAMVSDIYLIRTPVDIRPKSRFSDKRGTTEANYAKNSEEDKYEILMLIEPPRESRS